VRRFLEDYLRDWDIVILRREMLKLGGKSDVKNLQNAMMALFKSNATKIATRRLTTPGGSFLGEVYWITLENGNGIWGYFDDVPLKNKLTCWFGISLGSTNSEALVPSVEINLPLSLDLRIAGYALLDESRRLYLGHQGLLRGGRNNVPIPEFARRIRGFVREEFEITADKRPRLAFVIAGADDPDFLRRLHAYVSECARLRAEKRDETDREQAKEDGETNDADNAEDLKFTPEASDDGTGAGRSSYEIKRLHGRVVSALKKQVKGAVNSSHNKMRPDLYTMHGDRMSVLFEVKASSDTQSWFKAIGQLLVYSDGQTPGPRLIFVCPAERRDPAFRGALKRLNIRLVIFKESREGIIFQRLQEALA